MREVRGLRGRLTIAFAAVSALTVVLVGVLLLFPLNRKLREDAVSALTQTARSTRGSLKGLDAEHLRRAVNGVRHRTGAEALIIDANGTVVAASEPEPEDRFPQVARAIAENRVISGITLGQAQTVVPFEASRGRFALVLRRSLESVDSAQDVVQRSLVAAGLVAIAIAAVLGGLLATGLARRLIALRELAQRFASTGHAPDGPPDRRQDEIGDLARAFATMQGQLEVQEQARRTFVSTASHEMRTPLSSLRLMLDLARDVLEEEPPDVAEARDQVGRAQVQTERLAKLAAELLDLSRIDAGVPLRVEPIEMLALARAVAGEFAPRDERVLLVGGVEAWASADPGSAARIVRILVDNALRHAPAGGEVSVHAGVENDLVHVQVADDGPGVPAEDRDRIFERFERGTETQSGAGFGLGLAIGRELAERMGGRLRLDGSNHGAVFVLEVPRSVETGR